MKNPLIHTDKFDKTMKWIFIVYNLSLIPIIYIYSYIYIYRVKGIDPVGEAESWGREFILNYSPLSLFFECQGVFAWYTFSNFLNSFILLYTAIKYLRNSKIILALLIILYAILIFFSSIFSFGINCIDEPSYNFS